jgi:carbamoyl-phosphate synthase small subunit
MDLDGVLSLGCKVTVVPGKFPAADVMAMNPDGVFFSNGPGDPSAAPWAVENAKFILGKVPTFGICMGHQVMGQAFGATTYKLPFGCVTFHVTRTYAYGKQQQDYADIR